MGFAIFGFGAIFGNLLTWAMQKLLEDEEFEDERK